MVSRIRCLRFRIPYQLSRSSTKLITAIFENDNERSNRVIISALNSTLDKVRILDDVVFPTFNTINELYDRGRLGETEGLPC